MLSGCLNTIPQCFHRVWTTTQSMWVCAELYSTTGLRCWSAIWLVNIYLRKYPPQPIKTAPFRAASLAVPSPGGYGQFLLLLLSPQSHSVSYPFILNTHSQPDHQEASPSPVPGVPSPSILLHQIPFRQIPFSQITIGQTGSFSRFVCVSAWMMCLCPRRLVYTYWIPPRYTSQRICMLFV